AGQDFAVVVDYAHAPDSLEKILEMYKGLTIDGKVFAVFGATGGGRDRGKRSKMGMVAEKHADYIILTNDDPYSDDEMAIIEDIAKGITRKEGEGFWKIPDRGEAIRFALSLAEKGDSVIIAGKGAEEVMKIRGKTIPWNDKRIAEELLKRTLEVEIE
ncbi:UDP-N-acetylmuramoyl-L-alanyl-D-glutamate--2,6-diaminopimelate ligase, partial [Candidatus Peregrinibacteria bacterium]|nr:UDP-N-acetylmuramoyl-L-alanyl-D-glutamate--2,6-diaminopimelate ligase [Candidatus Peregrinibacteria bacterium]